jgi:hypothetical protein
MLERYNIVSLKNIQDAGFKLDAWSKAKQRIKPNDHLLRYLLRTKK